MHDPTKKYLFDPHAADAEIYSSYLYNKSCIIGCSRDEVAWHLDRQGRELAEIHWEGDSRNILAGFPEEVRADLGFALFEMQQGKRPSLAVRRMESIGAGVYELKEGDIKTWYRVIFLSRIDDVIYVLHCFKKDSRKTDRRDLKVAKERLSRVRQRIAEEKRDAKRFRE